MIKKLSEYIKEYKKDTILTPIFMILEVIMEMIIPLLMAAIIDNGLEGGSIKYVCLIGAAMLITAIFSLTFGALGGKYGASASCGFAKNLRRAMFHNIQDFSFENIDKYSTAGLVTRLTTDVTNVQNAFQMIIRMCVRAPISLICAMVMSFYINFKLSLIFVGAIIFLGLALYFIMTGAHPYFKEVFKKYDDKVTAVNDFNLTIEDKEFVVFVGPSGCGKSTTLRMIAGLEEISSGELWMDGQIMNQVKPNKRNVAMVFQNYALYPHMTVFENIAYSMKLKHITKKEMQKRVSEVAKILDIETILDRKPKELSGGQKQRVAIGRAMVRNPRVFLSLHRTVRFHQYPLPT